MNFRRVAECRNIVILWTKDVLLKTWRVSLLIRYKYVVNMIDYEVITKHSLLQASICNRWSHFLMSICNYRNDSESHEIYVCVCVCVCGVWCVCMYVCVVCVCVWCVCVVCGVCVCMCVWCVCVSQYPSRSRRLKPPKLSKIHSLSMQLTAWEDSTQI